MSESLHVTEPDVLRAVAHPLRRRALDVLRVHGPQTASLLAERTGEAVGNLSHHLRVLHRAGLVEPAPELARDRRERWWRLVRRGLQWAETDFLDDPAAAAAADAATRLGLQRQVELARAWLAAPDPAWRDAAFSTDAWLHLSPQELAELSEAVTALYDRYRDRPDDGAERRPVFLFARGFPAQP